MMRVKAQLAHLWHKKNHQMRLFRKVEPLQTVRSAYAMALSAKQSEIAMQITDAPYHKGLLTNYTGFMQSNIPEEMKLKITARVDQRHATHAWRSHTLHRSITKNLYIQVFQRNNMESVSLPYEAPAKTNLSTSLQDLDRFEGD
jgi:hypothetical protein